MILVGDRLLMIFFIFVYPLVTFADTHKCSLGIQFDGSDSLFWAQQSLVNETIYAVRLPHFTPKDLVHLRFVSHLLQIFCELDTGCALTGTNPAYIAGVLTSYYRTRPLICGIHIARTVSIILDIIYRKQIHLLSEILSSV